ATGTVCRIERPAWFPARAGARAGGGQWRVRGLGARARGRRRDRFHATGIRRMNHFRLSSEMIDPEAERSGLGDPAAGACVCFEGWVRNHNAGREVRRLEYQAYAELAEREGEAILAEALSRHGLRAAR